MKLLQAVVAVLTVLLFLARQNVFAGVCQVKNHSLAGFTLSSSSLHAPITTCTRGALSAGFSLPKLKKDPKIRVDNEDIDYPVE